MAKSNLNEMHQIADPWLSFEFELVIPYIPGETLRAVEGELTAIPCLASSVDCPHRGQCHTLDFWSGLNDLINKYVDGITLEQLRTMPEVPEISPETSETSETDL